MVFLKGQPWVDSCGAAAVPSALQLRLVGGDSGPPVTIPASVLIPFAPPDIKLQILSISCPCLSPITIMLPFSTSPTLLMVCQLLCQGKTDKVSGKKTAQKMIEDVEAVLALLCPGVRINMSDATSQLSCSQKLKIEVEFEDLQQHAVEELPVEEGEHSEEEDQQESGVIERARKIQEDFSKRIEAVQARLDALVVAGRKMVLPSRESLPVPVNEKAKKTCHICHKKCKNLPRHIKCFHSQIKETCPMCDRKLRVTYMESHIRNVHDKKAQACPHCGKFFVRLSQHIKKAHSNSKSITETAEMPPQPEEEEEGPFRNLRKRKNKPSVNLEDDSDDEPNREELNERRRVKPSISETSEMSPQEEEEGPYRNLRKRRNKHSVNMEDDSDDEPNREESDEKGPYPNYRKSNRHHRVESNEEENGGDGEMNDESLEEILFDCARHAKRKIVLPEDIQLARCIKYGC